MTRVIGGEEEYHLPPRHQADATIDQVAVQNTWITVLTTTSNVRIYGVYVLIHTANETLEVEVTVDGQTLVGAVAATAENAYEVFNSIAPDYVGFDLIAAARAKGYLLEGRSVQVRVRKTTVAGANNLHAKVVYARWP